MNQAQPTAEGAEPIQFRLAGLSASTAIKTVVGIEPIEVRLYAKENPAALNVVSAMTSNGDAAVIFIY
jgi:hypothetical protein